MVRFALPLMLLAGSLNAEPITIDLSEYGLLAAQEIEQVCGAEVQAVRESITERLDYMPLAVLQSGFDDWSGETTAETNEELVSDFRMRAYIILSAQDVSLLPLLFQQIMQHAPTDDVKADARNVLARLDLLSCIEGDDELVARLIEQRFKCMESFNTEVRWTAEEIIARDDFTGLIEEANAKLEPLAACQESQ